MTKKTVFHISTLGSRLTTTISVTLVLLILGLLTMTMFASHKLSDDIRRNIGFIVKVDRNASQPEINRLKQMFTSAPFVESLTFSTAEDILAEESRLMGEPIDSLVGENPFGAEFDIKVRPEYANTDSISSISAKLAPIGAISEIVTEKDVVNSINTAIHRLTIILSAIGLALLFISFVLINNTVSLAVYSRRFIIYTMKLVGATPGFIRRPFILAGMATGLIAAAIACAILVAIRAYSASIDPIFNGLILWEDFPLIAAIVFLAGLIICSLAALVATTRYLRADYDDMYMK